MSALATPWAAVVRRRPRGLLLGVLAIAVAALLVTPLVLIVVQAAQGGGQALTTLHRTFVAELLWNTVRLAAAVTVGCALLGTAAAWATERTNLIGRRVWAVLLVAPLMIPDFVLAWTWTSIFPAIHGFWGAALVMTLHLYPLVYLPMAAAFRSADPGQEELARSLGLSPIAAWWRVSVRQARSTLLGGCLLVALSLMSYYGAFEDLHFQTFTTAIYGEVQTQFSPQSAAALSLVLVVLTLLALSGEAVFADRGRLTRPHGAAARRPVRHRLGPTHVPAAAGLLALVVVALAFPIWTIAHWMAASRASSLPAGAGVATATLATVQYSLGGAALATLGALPVGLLAARYRHRWTRWLRRATFLSQALPGIVVGLALVFVASHYLPGVYQSPELLMFAYAVLFFPLVLVAMTASLERASRSLEEIGESLGRHPLAVRLRVTLPLLGPGLIAGFAFGFLNAATELTATLLLVPTGAQTLATQFWAYAEEGASFGAAAPYAATMVALSIVPTLLVTQWFDRSARSGQTMPQVLT